MSFEEISKSEVIGLEFPGQCKNHCCAINGEDGSLIFGTGRWNTSDHCWENTCNACGSAWRDFASYTFDLVVGAQTLIIQYSVLAPEEIVFNLQDLKELKTASRVLIVLSPFEHWIRMGAKHVSTAMDLIDHLDNFSANYTKRLAQRKKIQKDLEEKSNLLTD